jgi:nucleoporin GLE1
MMLDVMESPYQKALDGPARRLLCELGRLHRTDRYEFYASLDREADDREETHAAELAAAAAEHEQVRKNAESTRSWMEMKLNAERLERERWETEEREEAKRKYQEALEREREERQRKEERLIVLEAEKARHAEFAARKQALAEREGRKSEEAKRLVDKQRADDAKTASEKKDAGRQTAEAENKAKEATITVANASPESNPLSAVIERSKLNLESPSLDPRKEAEHRKYLQVHQRLKQLRKYLLEEAKQNRALKNRMGDSRRNIKKCVGQYLIGVEDIKSSEVLGGEKEVNDSNKRAVSLCLVSNKPFTNLSPRLLRSSTR